MHLISEIVDTRKELVFLPWDWFWVERCTLTTRKVSKRYQVLRQENLKSYLTKVIATHPFALRFIHVTGIF